MKSKVFILVCALLVQTCVISAPEDPVRALQLAQGLDLSSQTVSIDTTFDLNRAWVRGCETRIGNLLSDGMKTQTDSDIGVMAGGNIRDDQGITVLSKGTLSKADLTKVMPFNNTIYQVRLNAYRLKQNFEASASRLSTTQSATQGADSDSDGDQHGDCYFQSVSGSGRFLQVSSNVQVTINTANTAQVTTGTAADNSLAIQTAGNRIVKIVIDGSNVYENSSGDIGAGWSLGATSCTNESVLFSNSKACNVYTVAIQSFQALGNDSHPAFNPALAEVGNDGTVAILSSNVGLDIDIAFDYLLSLKSQGQLIKTTIEGRILFQ